MERPKPSIEELIERVETLSRSIEKMVGAVRTDVAALREDVKRLSTAAAFVAPTAPALAGLNVPTVPPVITVPPASVEPPAPRHSAAVPKKGFTEEAAPRRKRDPRMDDE